jgi:phenylacetate-CoA ligase
MTDAWMMKLYHRLPAAGRSAAASARGLYLRSWRYGRRTEALIEAARERETWSPPQWKRYQEEQLAFVLHRAATLVPYYRHQWETRRRLGYRGSWEQLENWPILSKEMLRTNAQAFVADDCRPRRMFRERTSGTTGKPLDLWRRGKTVETLYAISELRERRWYGVSVRDRWAMLGGQLVVPAENRRPPFWVWNAALNQLYMSTFHLSPAYIPCYVDALESYGIKYLWGYPSSLLLLAHEVINIGRAPLQMSVVITNAEPVTEHQRQTIAQAFGCPVRETYGMAEMVTAGSECEAGRLHQWPEVGLVEVLMDDADAPVAPGESGRLIGTSLLNTDMPLIRYEVGDRASGKLPQHPCECGRSLPALQHIEGRTNDLILTPDGRSVYWLNPVFYGVPIRESQIIQEEIDQLRVLVVPAPGFRPETARSIVERLQARVGQVQVEIESVESIPRTSGGKFRAVVNRLPMPAPIGSVNAQ